MFVRFFLSQDGFCNNSCRFKLAEKILLDIGSLHHLGQVRICFCCLWLWRTLLAELMYRAILALVCTQQRFSAHAFTFAWNCIFEGPVIKCLSALPSRSVNKHSTSSRWGALDVFAGCFRSTFQVRLRLLGFSR